EDLLRGGFDLGDMGRGVRARREIDRVPFQEESRIYGRHGAALGFLRDKVADDHAPGREQLSERVAQRREVERSQQEPALFPEAIDLFPFEIEQDTRLAMLPGKPASRNDGVLGASQQVLPEMLTAFDIRN